MTVEDSLLATDAAVQNQSIAIKRVHNSDITDVADLITVEEPLEIRIASSTAAEFTLSVTMRTPGADTQLALGFLFGEGLISKRSDVEGVEYCGPPSPDKGLQNVIKVSLSPGVEIDPSMLERHTYTTSSCGVCGKTSIDAIRIVNPYTIGAALVIDRQTVTNIPSALREQQTEFAKTGGLHGVGVFDESGSLGLVYEDIGRHNAMDKLIGHLFNEDTLPMHGCGLVLSGRASFELVQKASMAGAEIILAVGPPSSLAVELALDQGITLAGFVGTRGFNIYTHADRIR